MQIKLIFTRKVLHLAWLWKWEFLKLGNNLLIVLITFRLKCIYSCFTRFSNTMATIATKKESNQNTVVWFLYYIMMVNNSCQTNKFQNSDQQFQRNRIFRSNRLNFISDETRLRIKKVVTYSQGISPSSLFREGFLCLKAMASLWRGTWWCDFRLKNQSSL